MANLPLGLILQKLSYIGIWRLLGDITGLFPYCLTANDIKAVKWSYTVRNSMGIS